MKFTAFLTVSALLSTVAAANPSTSSSYLFSRTSIKELIEHFRNDANIESAYTAGISALVKRCPPSLEKAKIEIAYASGEFLGSGTKTNSKEHQSFAKEIKALNKMKFIYLIEDGICGTITIEREPQNGRAGDRFNWSKPSFRIGRTSASYPETVDFTQLMLSPRRALKKALRTVPYLKNGFGGVVLSKWMYKAAKQPVYTFTMINGRDEKEQVHVGAIDGKVYLP